MILKFLDENGHWVLMGNIRRAELSFIDRPADMKCTPEETSRSGRRILFDTTIEDAQYTIDVFREAYLLNDDGKTIERIA